MEFKEFTKKLQRMCRKQPCRECPINQDGYFVGDACKMWTLRNPDEAEKIVSTWAKEHPVRTYLMDFKEKFPKSTYSDSKICCNVCRGCLYGQKESLDECLCGDCEECWNQEVQND
ncbi:hypothetical protein NIA71_19750 [Ihubacter massiliensis]|uniref:hypothetical protein n=1 Tax=Ihubacter massiliensis TaxID=1852367 RepID=UPI0011DE349A|nr:hypothetical protein [Ihubacter massiliensis]MCO7124156.1 hypothetical protein [Ihubacter massiliensis]